MHVVLIGNTGSGKTTVAKALEERLNLPRISSGDIARGLGDFDPATKLALESGAFAPEEAMRIRVRSLLEAAEIQRGGWVIEGFPRMIEQLICLMQWTSALPVFVYLEIEPWVAVERLVARGRPDDNPNAIAKKLASFEEKTHPMISLLEGGGVLHTVAVDGRTPSQVVDDVEAFCRE